MRCVRLAICMAVFACVSGLTRAEDMDVKAIQAKLAAQEARINDLQAKMAGADCDEGVVADGLTSLRKNAVVTIGGTVNTRYFYRSGNVKSSVLSYYDATGNPTGTGDMNKIAKARGGDLFIADAKLEGKIDVNDYFDAYFKFDLQSSGDWSDNAEQYWVRWKNICNSGFGVVVGRDDLKYGMAPVVGVLDSWSGTNDTNGYGEMFSDFYADDIVTGGSADGFNVAGIGRMIAASGTMTPFHSTWDHSRVVQVNPYWTNSDETFTAELSFFQRLDSEPSGWTRRNGSNGYRYRSNHNDGIGSMTGRVTWKPVEGLTLVASAMNQYNKNATSDTSNHDFSWGEDGKKNNFAASFGFEYTPCFFDKITLWGYYQHGWNEAWIDNYDTDLINAGIKFDFTDEFYGFVRGDYLYGKDKNNRVDEFYKAKGWSGDLGFGYVLPYGANFEAGYRHEKIDYKNRQGVKHTKYKADVVYAHLGFNF